MWWLKLWAWWTNTKAVVYDTTHEPYDDGRSFSDMMDDGLQGVRVHLTDPHTLGAVFWQNGHLVRRTRYGVEHFDSNCPQERDAALYAAVAARRATQEAGRP